VRVLRGERVSSEAVKGVLVVIEKGRKEKIPTLPPRWGEGWLCEEHGFLEGPEEYLMYANRCQRRIIPVYQIGHEKDDTRPDAA
jgi:hypothetical protein